MNRRHFISSLVIAFMTMPTLVKAACTARRLGPLQTKVCQNFFTELDPTGRYAGFMVFEETWPNGPQHRFRFISVPKGNRVIVDKIDRITEHGPVEVREFDQSFNFRRLSIREICENDLMPISREILDPPTITVSWREMEDIT